MPIAPPPQLLVFIKGNLSSDYLQTCYNCSWYSSTVVGKKILFFLFFLLKQMLLECTRISRSYLVSLKISWSILCWLLPGKVGKVLKKQWIADGSFVRSICWLKLCLLWWQPWEYLRGWWKFSNFSVRFCAFHSYCMTLPDFALSLDFELGSFEFCFFQEPASASSRAVCSSLGLQANAMDIIGLELCVKF